MSSMEMHSNEQDIKYSSLYKPKKDVKVIKKDGSLEAFNVQKVIDAVGKSAYRALTKFTDEEKQHICQYVVDKV
ncbi:MAG: anaerobic ribonucleoside-triphosphate reductase, partial [Lachnospiraceae bacterium]|nr:anaerobic ribonucleoside-triphosphate reductase [Lachnospiraceae bacterium]